MSAYTTIDLPDGALPVTLIEGDGHAPFASITLSPDPGTAKVFVKSAAQAGELIKAAVTAKDLLAAGQHTEPPGCGAELAHFESASGSFRCTREAGHDGDHEAGGARPVDEPPLTWPQGTEPPASES